MILYVFVYIYIYIYIERERERDRESHPGRSLGRPKAGCGKNSAKWKRLGEAVFPVTAGGRLGWWSMGGSLGFSIIASGNHWFFYREIIPKWLIQVTCSELILEKWFHHPQMVKPTIIPS